MDNKIDIVVCLDKGYVMPTGVMIYSVCANNPDSTIDFHLVVDESVSDNDKKDLIDTISPFEGKKALFYHVNSHLYKNYPLTNSQWLTLATYYRILLPEILPDSVNKVIYLDGDCVVRHSLIPLWRTDISEIAIAAVFNAFEGQVERYKSSFVKYQNQTKWKGIKIEKRPLKDRFKDCIGEFLRYIKILPPLKLRYIELSPID